MQLRHSLKLISGLTAGVMMIMALLVFLCPMTGMSNMQPSAVFAPALFMSGSPMTAASHNMQTRGSCFNSHLTTARRLAEILLNESILLLIAFLGVAGIRLKMSKTELFLAARVKLARYRHRSRLYNTFIRLKCQRKVLAWLSILENPNIALLA